MNNERLSQFATDADRADITGRSVSMIDAYGFSCRERESYTVERLTFALARFGSRIAGAAVYMNQDTDSENVKYDCRITVMLDNCGIVSVKRSGPSPHAALNQAVESVEPRVAFRVDWRSYFNRETFSLWQHSLQRRMDGLGVLFQRHRPAFRSSLTGH